MFEFIRKFFRPPPEYLGSTNGATIRTLLDTPTSRVLDRTYNIVSIDSFIKYAKFNTISNEKYVAETHDCDEFSFEFYVAARKWAPGIPVGIVLGTNIKGNPHAWNCFVDVHNKKLYFFEPISDVMFEPSTEYVWEIII